MAVWKVPSLLQACVRDGVVLDVGCLGFLLVREGTRLDRNDLRHHGIDYDPPESVPSGVTFARCNLDNDSIPFPDDSFDLVVASHVIEHLANPIRLFMELVRVTRPGGTIYVEAPSERSLWLPGVPFGFGDFRTVSFYDDPTHLGRPWPPQALYRLARCCGCDPLEVGRRWGFWGRLKAPAKLLLSLIFRRSDWYESGMWELVGWPSYMIARKPADLSGAPAFRYASRPV
jgi:SAM-dependent methyltransferase